uniref:VWFA domain-containing protein n=1 Tax=Falco tinnunculus TaxID=100819 RepID=A0A8C4VHJ7_FALTI
MSSVVQKINTLQILLLETLMPLDVRVNEDCILEIAFLLDSSESAKDYNHEQQKKFVLETVDRMKSLQLSSGRTLSWRMALLQYSSTVFIEQTFHDWKGPEAFKSHIAPITYIGHGTYTTYAITNLTQLYLTEGTPGSVKVAVFFTDGVDHPRNPDIFAATADAKHQGIVFFMMGMTRVAEEVSNAAKLRLLASIPASRFSRACRQAGLPVCPSLTLNSLPLCIGFPSYHPSHLLWYFHCFLYHSKHLSSD